MWCSHIINYMTCAIISACFSSHDLPRYHYPCSLQTFISWTHGFWNVLAYHIPSFTKYHNYRDIEQSDFELVLSSTEMNSHGFTYMYRHSHRFQLTCFWRLFYYFRLFIITPPPPLSTPFPLPSPLSLYTKSQWLFKTIVLIFYLTNTRMLLFCRQLPKSCPHVLCCWTSVIAILKNENKNRNMRTMALKYDNHAPNDSIMTLKHARRAGASSLSIISR